jgi:alpha-amylase/alpha-mannosidase (GH57 family)
MPAAPQRFACIHGHFYQPPRENPWLETIQVQDSAAPYHDWNERITVECYAPNTATRVLDVQGRITALRNNYGRISFNFGPTLLSWMEQARPDVYAQILLADQQSIRHFGRGNAIAQAYGHCIMPLASRRDQLTQVRWGIADFVHRFGRRPDGMWLPETAADRATLAVLAEHGLRFTILAPTQAARVRYGDGEWEDVYNGSIDCTRPYRCTLGRGRDIVVFFYDADIARAVAFGGLLNDGRTLAARLSAAAAAAAHPGPPLAHVATDGESYGHHHRFGDMALAAAIDALEHDPHVRLTNYAAYLDQVDVRDTIEIHDRSSWSCVHGVERWRAHCGCNSGGHPDWHQTWRTPLREALDWLKTRLDDLFEREGAKLLRDPWAARDAYISVLLRRDTAQRDAFVEQHATGSLRERQRPRLWKLLEMQRHALLSFTSCGWFFDEASGIETVQVLAYAARALQLAAELGSYLEPEFMRHLQPLRSNLPIYADGYQLYQALVRPQASDGHRMVAHYALGSLFREPPAETRTPAYRLTAVTRTIERAGDTSLATGRVEVVADMTEEQATAVYAALHLGGRDLHCAVAPGSAAAETGQITDALQRSFRTESLAELVGRMDAFGTSYTLRAVGVETRRQILEQITARAANTCLSQLEQLVHSNRRLLDFFAQDGLPLPAVLRAAATCVLERQLQHAVARFAAGEDSGESAVAVVTDARRWGVTPGLDDVRPVLDAALVDAMRGLGANVERAAARAHAVLDLAQALAAKLQTWEAENLYYRLVTGESPHRTPRKAERILRCLGERLTFQLPEWDRHAPEAT